MTTLNENSKALIIGAGPGGLVLAQVLRRHNIPFEIFERDEGVHGRKQGWAVALVECIPHLLELLPKDIGDLQSVSVNYGVEDSDTLAVLNALTGEHLASLGGAACGEPGYVLRASREHLREFLWKDIAVNTGKNFSHYVEDREGVTAYFQDGSSARGTILVGADGANSHVRAQLLGEDHRPVLSKYVPIIGECELPRHIYEPIRNIGTSAILAGSLGLRYLIGQRSIKPDRSSASYYFAVCFQSDDPAADSAWVQAASKQSLFKKCLELTKEMPEYLTDIIHHTGPDGMVTPPIKFVEFVPPKALPRGRVTLIGDAAHSMIPFRGLGANTAVRDACDLARLFMKAVKEGESWDWLLHEYENTMVPRGKEMVLSSRAAGEQVDGIMSITKGRTATMTGATNENKDVGISGPNE